MTRQGKRIMAGSGGGGENLTMWTEKSSPSTEIRDDKSYGSYWTPFIYYVILVAILSFAVWVTFATLTRPDTEFIVGKWLTEDISPYTMGALGIAFALGFSVLGAAW